MSLEKYLEALENGTTFSDVKCDNVLDEGLNTDGYEAFAGSYWTAKLKVEKEKLRKRGMADQAEKLSIKDIMGPHPVKDSRKTNEEVELEESSIKQKQDHMRVIHGVMSQKEYNEKWNKKKKTNKLAGPGGLYKNLVKEEVKQLDELRSPFHKAATELEKHAKKLGDNHMDHKDFMNHASMLKSGDPRDWRTSASAIRHLDTGARDTILDNIHKHTKKTDLSKAYYKASGHTRIAEDTELNESSWIDARSDYDGPGKGQTLLKMSEKDHADAINHHKTEMHHLSKGTHKYQKMYSKQQINDKYHYHAHMASLHKDALDHHQTYNESYEEKDTSALDAMDAKEARKDKIRKYVKNQSPVKIKRTPGRPDVQKEEVDLDEAVSIEHDRVIRSHGKKNTHTGHALWMFTNKRTGDVDYDNDRECHQISATRKDAQKSAKEWAKKHGHDKIYFMESVEDITESSDTDNIMKAHKDLSKHTIESLYATHSRVKSEVRPLPPGMKKATLNHIANEIKRRKDAGEKPKSSVVITRPSTGERIYKELDK